MSNYDPSLHVHDHVDPILRMMSEDQYMGSGADIDLVSEEIKTSDMVRLIRERLEQFKADKGYQVAITASTSGKDTPLDPRCMGTADEDRSPYRSGPYAARPFSASADWGMYEPAGDFGKVTRTRAYSGGVSRDEGSSWDVWAPPQQARRATYDESDFNRRTAAARPAWKCKHCGGVAWSEEDPCEGCGRFLPVANVAPKGPPSMRPGDWMCTSCANTNWEWRTQCNRCHTCREEEPVFVEAPANDLVKQRLKKRLSTHPAGVFKDNDWVCVSCGNINWDWRSKCHQCSTCKPVAKPSKRPIKPPANST